MIGQSFNYRLLTHSRLIPHLEEMPQLKFCYALWKLINTTVTSPQGGPDRLCQRTMRMMEVGKQVTKKNIDLKKKILRFFCLFI